MNSVIFQIIKEIDVKNIEVQIAVQCAPLITGIKISNLLITHYLNIHRAQELLYKSGISYQILLISNQKAFIFLYKEKELEGYLSKKKVKETLNKIGYQTYRWDSIQASFQKRYREYMLYGAAFPHELGLLLGYPVEDVDGFIINGGKNHLYSGYWKVYDNVPEKLKLFQSFEKARETMVLLIFGGLSILEILDLYKKRNQKQAAI